jgi:integrase
MVGKAESGSDLQAHRVTMADYFDRWLAAVEENARKPRTVEGYRQILRVHVIPYIGEIKLARLTPLHVQNVYTAARDKGRSETTVLHIHRAIFSALRQAVKWDLIERNVAESVIAPKASSREVKGLSPDELRRVLETVAGTDLEVPVMIASGTGMRLGEVLGIRWADIDLDKAEARVRQTISIDGMFDTPEVAPVEAGRSPSFVRRRRTEATPQGAGRATAADRDRLAGSRPRV